jgi:hypothetical protein
MNLLATETTTGKVKRSLEIISLLIGITLGVLTLWGQLDPRQRLVAEIFITLNRLRPDVETKNETLPQRVRDMLIKDEEYKKIVSDEKNAVQLADRIEKLVKFQNQYDRLFTTKMLPFLIICTIRNTGRQTLYDVRLTAEDWMEAPAIIHVTGGDDRVINSKGLFELGSIPPKSQIEIFTWNIPIIYERRIKIDHRDGKGSVSLTRLVPEDGGFWITYRSLTLLGIAGLLIIIGFPFIRRQFGSMKRRND